MLYFGFFRSGQVVFSPRTRDSALQCSSYLGISTQGSQSYPGTGTISLYEIRRPESIVEVGQATYDSNSFTVTAGSCTIVFAPSSILTTNQPGDAEGMLKISLSRLDGPNYCAERTPNWLWQLWSAAGDILFVPIEVSPTDAYYTAAFGVTNGSTSESGSITSIAVAKDRQIEATDISHGVYSAYPPLIRVTTGECVGTFTVAASAPNPANWQFPPQEINAEGPCEKPTLQWQVRAHKPRGPDPQSTRPSNRASTRAHGAAASSARPLSSHRQPCPGATCRASGRRSLTARTNPPGPAAWACSRPTSPR